MEGVDSRVIGDKVTVPWEYAPEFNAVPRTVSKLTRPGDMVLTIGAGTVTMLADEILRELEG